MKNLKQVSITFMKQSKILSLSCISSIFMAVILIVGMCNFSLNVKNSYNQSLRAAYGDCDVLGNYEDYEDMPQTIIDSINKMNVVKEVASGRFNNKLMIDDNNVYAIGAHDSNMMKSRYGYTVKLLDNEIVINNVLADILKCRVGDTINITGKELMVSEIIEENTMSASSITMAIMTQSTLSLLTGEKDNSNFIMIKGKNNVSINTIIKKIQNLGHNLELMEIEADPLYKNAVKSFSIFINVMTIVVMLVAILFVTSIFNSFLYKYNHDMAVLRAIGGKTKQIQKIFSFIALSITGIGCVIGFILSILLNKVLLKLINYKIGLINGGIKFYFFLSIIVTLVIFLSINLMLNISLRKNLKILPIAAITNNELNKIGKVKKHKKSNIFVISKLFGKDFYISIKMISTKMKENILIIYTIMMIVVLSFVGASLSSIILYNNNNYLKNQYLTDIVVTSSSYVDYKGTQEIYEQLSNCEGIQASLILCNGEDATIGEQKITYQMADLNKMEQQGILQNKVDKENRVVVSSELAKKLGIQVGSLISICTPAIYSRSENGFRQGLIKKPEEQKLYVSAILPKNKLLEQDVFIDIRNKAFLQNSMGINRIYISGNLDSAENILNKIKVKYSGIKWSNYKDELSISKKVIKEQFQLFEIIVDFLILVAGIGWFNSIKSIILSRRREYCILRMQGVSVNILRRIILIQIIIYLFIGIILGIMLGSIVLIGLLYLEQGSFKLILNLKTTIIIIAFLSSLSLLLLPTVKKISEDKLLVQNN